MAIMSTAFVWDSKLTMLVRVDCHCEATRFAGLSWCK